MKHILILMLVLSYMLTALADERSSTTTRRDSDGKTVSTETKTGDTTKVRDSQGKTSETKTETKNKDGSTTTTHRDSQGRTTSTEKKK